MSTRTAILLAVLATGLLLDAGCGSSKSASPATTAAASAPATTAPATTAPAPTGPGALQVEANATAAGDIPDNQVFLRFANAAAHYSLKYPEGWAQTGAGPNVTLRNKNNIVRITVAAGAAPTIASVRSDVAGLKGAQANGGPKTVKVGPATAFEVVYSTTSAPNPVTGKRVTLTVDRYYLTHGGKHAVVDLGSPVGVDNVDAYRLMIESFRWG
ncbi:MAG: hypothetical protein ACR2MU_04110 [Gaiellaceae bacterium]